MISVIILLSPSFETHQRVRKKKNRQNEVKQQQKGKGTIFKNETPNR